MKLLHAALLQENECTELLQGNAGFLESLVDGARRNVQALLAPSAGCRSSATAPPPSIVDHCVVLAQCMLRLANAMGTPTALRLLALQVLELLLEYMLASADETRGQIAHFLSRVLENNEMPSQAAAHSSTPPAIACERRLFRHTQVIHSMMIRELQRPEPSYDVCSTLLALYSRLVVLLQPGAQSVQGSQACLKTIWCAAAHRARARPPPSRTGLTACALASGACYVCAQARSKPSIIRHSCEP